MLPVPAMFLLGAVNMAFNANVARSRGQECLSGFGVGWVYPLRGERGGIGVRGLTNKDEGKARHKVSAGAGEQEAMGGEQQENLMKRKRKVGR